MSTLSYGRNARPYLYGQELEAVAEVLETGQYGHGEVTERFEKEIAYFLGVPDAVAVSSGTAALHIALLAAGIGPGDEVIVPSFTFCATVHAIVASGAAPRFAEVNPDTGCVDSHSIAEALNPATRAVLPVLYGGRAVELYGLRDELAGRGITVVEDAAHAFGSYQGIRRVGATGALTCFSFGPIKNLTCGQGGAIIPRDPQEAERARAIRLLGISATADDRTRTTTYRVQGIGLRAHLSQINAAIGLAQLPHFSTAQTRRKQLWRSYATALKTVDAAILVDADVEHAVPSLCAVRVPDRDRVFDSVRARGIGAGTHYPPNHLQPAFARWHRPLPVTERLGQQILTLPFHQHMSDHDVQVTVAALAEALS
ncbi:DegT/DnrJ/EryC1/StrS family aminotransferase [Streptomyces sp. O3]